MRVLPCQLAVRKAGFFSGLMMALSSAAACTDSAITWQVAQQRDLSEWREFDAIGRQLVRESGRLTGPELALTYQCGNWQLDGRMAELKGSRLYNGQTNTGVPVVSQSAIGQRQGQLQASFALSQSWRIGARWTVQSMARDIASAGGASGYPEHLDWRLLSIGAQWQTHVGQGELTAGAWLGQQVGSSMQVTLPGRDTSSLPLGAIRHMDFALGWRMPLSPAWHVQVDAGFRKTEIGEGTEVIMTRNGVPVGVAHQPRSVLLSRPLSIRLGYAF